MTLGLQLPKGSATEGVVIGIDPGSDTLGFACIHYDLKTRDIIRSYSKTFKASSMYLSPVTKQTHGARYARIYKLAEVLLEMFLQILPTHVVCESPFMAMRRPQAYGALMETVFAIRTAIRNYDESLALDLVDPPSAKNAVGAPGNAKKEQVFAAIKKVLDTLKYDSTEYSVEFNDLDEHSIDALAIAFWRMKKLQQE